MNSKGVVLFTTFCLLGPCWGERDTTQGLCDQDVPMEPMDGASGNLHQNAVLWRRWRPWKLWKWGCSMLNKGLTHSSNKLESEPEGRHIHNNHPKRKVKKKLKVLFKIQQYES